MLEPVLLRVVTVVIATLQVMYVVYSSNTVGRRRTFETSKVCSNQVLTSAVFEIVN